MKHILSLLFSIVIISSAIAQNDNRLKGLDKELNKILEVTKAAGFAVAIVDGDKVIYAKGFGYSDYENKIPADANTLFAIGSSTKAFTASILGQLREEDQLSFDDSPLKYVPELKFYNDDMNNHIIIKDLMSHRTGLPRHDFSWYLFPSADKDSLLQRVKYQEPFTGIRQQWYYNNFMFLAQGVIAERITGKSWEANIKERFFTPLDMTRSNVNIEELEKSSNTAFGYELKKGDVISKMDYYKIGGMSPAGSINSSVNDMSKWLITWLNKGKYKDQSILSEAYLNEAISSQMVITPSLPDAKNPDMHISNYGYGWMIASYRGHYRVEHGGNIDGFSASVAFFPSDNLGIVVLANQNGSAVPGLVRNTIADRLLQGEKTNWTKRFIEGQEQAKKAGEEVKTKSTSTKVKNTKPSHNLLEYAGKYSNLGYGEFDIKVENDSLFAIFKLKKLYLKHYHYDIFEPFEATTTAVDTSVSSPLRFNFITNDVGDISYAKMQIEPTLDPIEFKRSPNTITVNKIDLEKYTGDYNLLGTPLKVYIKDENVLYLFVPGQPEYELIATAKHKFSFKIIEGFKVEFFESDDASINEMNVIQPNGTFKATRKK